MGNTPFESRSASSGFLYGRGLGYARLVIWSALLAGLLDSGILLAQRFVLGRITGQSPDGIWQAPLAYCALFALPALGVAAATARASERLALSLRLALLALLFWGSLLLFLFMRVHWAALALLAIGLTYQTVRLVRAHLDGFGRLVRRSLPLAAALVLLLMVALPGGRWLAERRALGALPPASQGALNVILLILDTVRAPSMGLYGGPRPNTPQLERLARGGVLFEQPITNAPWTLASHAALFTGRPVHELGVGWERSLDDRYPTIAEVLRDRGYLTAGFTANFYYTTWESGLQRGFVHYDAQPLTVAQALKSTALGQMLDHVLFGLTLEERTSDRRRAAEINRAFLDWLDGAGERPFFAFLNYIDAHLPYDPPEPFRSRFHADSSELHAYEASIAYADHMLGALVDSLERRGLLSSTLLLVTSDHGELLGEHGLHGHTSGLYLPLLHVPLVLALPGTLPSGVRLPGAVQLSDLPATIQDLTRTRQTRTLPGRSLAPRWNGAAVTADTVLTQYDATSSLSLFDGRMHYILRPGGQERLFDTAADPGELRNLIDSVGPAVLRPLRQRVRALSLPAPKR